MSEVIELGRRQQHVAVILSRGSTWEVTLTPVAFPAGTTVTLTMGDRTFPADVTADAVSWRLEAADTDPIPNGTPVRVLCVFPDTPTPTPVAWLKGTVQRDD
ncbi:LtfC-like domain-containing protein [Prescottella equi]|uniref:LtfC-like domain-containing protein n=1 Tax=Rhodococcus hoagii TaxID=43767 RepID=UPI0027DD104A|nr:hypothetical protein [Prescottella equi]